MRALFALIPDKASSPEKAIYNKYMSCIWLYDTFLVLTSTILICSRSAYSLFWFSEGTSHSLQSDRSGWLDRLRFRLPVYRPSNFLKGVSQHHRICAWEQKYNLRDSIAEVQFLKAPNNYLNYLSCSHKLAKTNRGNTKQKYISTYILHK